jgi:hypothetical protein
MIQQVIYTYILYVEIQEQQNTQVYVIYCLYLYILL